MPVSRCSSSWLGSSLDRGPCGPSSRTGLVDAAHVLLDQVGAVGAQRHSRLTQTMSSTDAEYAVACNASAGGGGNVGVPNPYRWNVRRLAKGRVLDVGCGIGRCLDFIRPRGVGVDPNEQRSPSAARRVTRHTCRMSSSGARSPPLPASSTHCCARMCSNTSTSRLRWPWSVSTCPIRQGGRVHLHHSPGARSAIRRDARAADGCRRNCRRWPRRCGLTIERMSSFPLPRLFGRWFMYNETVVVARRGRDEGLATWRCSSLRCWWSS